jgi:TolB-like protein/DNA-binding winged helix-turn-helix (wHTH) protein/tetratricopeptide (TPR) repeat protein
MQDTLLKFRQFELRVATYELRCAGEPVKLERIPMDLLILLVEKRGELVTREAIIERVWGEKVFLDTEHSINTAINKLRGVLHDVVRSPVFIQTVVGKGYRFIAHVDTVAAAGEITDVTVSRQPVLVPPAFATPGATVKEAATREISSLTPITALPQTLAEPSISQNGRRSRRGWLFWGVFATATILVVFVASLWRARTALASPNKYRSVAVLPFLNLSDHPEQEYLVEGLTDRLTTVLAQATGLRVISRTSTMQYKGVKQALPEIASALNVDAVVEGSMMRAGKVIRITAQLVDARRDQHLWAQTYEEGGDSLLPTQDKIVADIVRHVGKRLGNEALVIDERPVNPQARDLYLRGEYLLHQRTESSITRAIDYYHQAIEVQPDFAAAYAAAGEAYVLLGSNGLPDSSNPMRLARQSAEKALQLDSRLGQAHTVLAAVKVDLDWDWDGAENEFRQALTLNPSDPTTHHWYALHLARMKRFPEAEEQMDRALDLDSVAAVIEADRAVIAYYARQPEVAHARAARALELDSNFSYGHLILGTIYDQSAQYREALQEYDRAAQLFGHGANMQILRARALALSGHRNEAEQIAAELASASPRRYVSGVDVGLVYCALGNTKEAMKWFEKGYAERARGMDILGVDPVFDACRSDPAFLKLLQQMKLP